MQWLQEAFLGYLTKWRASVTSRDVFTLADKALMPLSRETEGGLFMTGMCICMQCGDEAVQVYALSSCMLCFFHAYSEVISRTDEISLGAAYNP